MLLVIVVLDGSFTSKLDRSWATHVCVCVCVRFINLTKMNKDDNKPLSETGSLKTLIEYWVKKKIINFTNFLYK